MDVNQSERPKRNWRSTIQRIVQDIILFFAVILLYVIFEQVVFSFFGAPFVSGVKDIFAFLFTLNVLDYPLHLWGLILFVGLPALIVKHLSRWISPKLGFVLFPLVGAALVFVGGIIHRAVFELEWSRTSAQDEAGTFMLTAMIFQAVFVLALAIFRLLQKKRRGEVFDAAEEEEKQKAKTRAKYVVGFLLVIVMGTFSLWAVSEFRLKSEQKRLLELAREMERKETEIQERRMADAYGGKTPQETLQLYIDAVEKGDYELASRYLVEEERTNEVTELNALSAKGNVSVYLSILKAAKGEGEASGNVFRMNSKTSGGASYFVRFVLYPNGVWKITDI